ncbi:hypothetical protein PISMIDRAFT_121993 [Pisolithus microcarpus 441]|uniref:Unplaced genomic scaffold scaffold_469, whole genome shotgun sequence n=1 Tax=Pisolithus microcarpus 441 TaxID=765257 RepID=A0A0C9Y416_9AGAM|nr:hypothetical protein PISMIDRAFT_121993 [Pisolithus microcarpus 441]
MSLDSTEDKGAYAITQAEDDMFMRQTNPFNPKRIDFIMSAVQVGNDLSMEEKEQVDAFIKEYADVFACSIKEVLLIPGVTIDLNVPPYTMFTTSPRQRPLSPLQKTFMHKWV